MSCHIPLVLMRSYLLHFRRISMILTVIKISVPLQPVEGFLDCLISRMSPACFINLSVLCGAIIKPVVCLQLEWKSHSVGSALPSSTHHHRVLSGLNGGARSGSPGQAAVRHQIHILLLQSIKGKAGERGVTEEKYFGSVFDPPIPAGKGHSCIFFFENFTAPLCGDSRISHK